MDQLTLDFSYRAGSPDGCPKYIKIKKYTTYKYKHYEIYKNKTLNNTNIIINYYIAQFIQLNVVIQSISR